MFHGTTSQQWEPVVLGKRDKPENGGNGQKTQIDGNAKRMIKLMNEDGLDEDKLVYKPNYVAFGKQVQAVRMKYGLSQDALAKKISKSVQDIKAIENGKPPPNLQPIITVINQKLGLMDIDKKADFLRPPK